MLADDEKDAVADDFFQEYLVLTLLHVQFRFPMTESRLFHFVSNVHTSNQSLQLTTKTIQADVNLCSASGARYHNSARTSISDLTTLCRGKPMTSAGGIDRPRTNDHPRLVSECHKSEGRAMQFGQFSMDSDEQIGELTRKVHMLTQTVSNSSNLERNRAPEDQHSIRCAHV
jgi:hypothetical protein